MAREARFRHGVRAIMCIACVCLVLCGSSSASDKVRLRARDAVGFAGGQAIVDIAMDADPRPSAIGFWIEYDTTRATFIDAVPGAVVTLAGKDVSWDFPSPGRVSFLIFGLNDTRIAPGKVLTLMFAIDEDVDPGEDISINGLNESATNPDTSPIPTEFEDGDITILQCFNPAAPANFTATDGLFGDHVQLSWTPVFGAQSYAVLRSTVNDPATATVLGVTVLPFYSDFSAAGAFYGNGGGGGCGGSTGQSLQYTEYYYWIRAQSICGNSPLAAESGWRGKDAASAKASVSIDALPTAPNDTTSQVALRLSARTPIEPGSIAAQVDEGPAEIASIDWQPADDAGTDGWIVVSLVSPLDSGGSVAISATAKTIGGAAVGPVTHLFVSGGPLDLAPSPVVAKSGDVLAVVRLETSAVPGFIESMGPQYAIEPAAVYGAAHRVCIPLPAGVEPGEVLPHLYVAGEGWYPAPRVEGWIVPGSITVTDAEGISCVAFDVHYGGIVQLGYPSAPPTVPQPANWAGGIPTAIAAIALVLAGARRRFAHPRR